MAFLVRNGSPRRDWLGQCFAAQGGALLPNISGKEEISSEINLDKYYQD